MVQTRARQQLPVSSIPTPTRPINFSFVATAADRTYILDSTRGCLWCGSHRSAPLDAGWRVAASPRTVYALWTSAPRSGVMPLERVAALGFSRRRRPFVRGFLHGRLTRLSRAARRVEVSHHRTPAGRKVMPASISTTARVDSVSTENQEYELYWPTHLSEDERQQLLSLYDEVPATRRLTDTPGRLQMKPDEASSMLTPNPLRTGTYTCCWHVTSTALREV